MGFKLKVEGPSTIELGTTIITGVKFRTDIPHDSNARSTDMGSTVTITGKILTAVDGDPFDNTRQLGLWALVPAEKSDCYRKVSIEVIAASQVVRKYTYPNAFVVDYRGRLWRCGRRWKLYTYHQAEERQDGAGCGRRRIQRIIKGFPQTV